MNSKPTDELIDERQSRDALVEQIKDTIGFVLYADNCIEKIGTVIDLCQQHFSQNDLVEENKKLREMLEFALAGLSSVPHSWGYGITHVKTIERRLQDLSPPKTKE